DYYCCAIRSGSTWVF
nr:immunoglobulin light chain junction region [Macaca mulatta]MOW18043.1 immunoglobulin light chain junction region [Macaca mulatta]MOW18092.1 immunoglobulin light chain junction region [Macaca mulatta]